MLIVKIQNGSPRRLRPAACKQNLLRAKIFFHRVVVIEMIARKVREHGHVKRNPENPLLLERVR